VYVVKAHVECVLDGFASTEAFGPAAQESYKLALANSLPLVEDPSQVNITRIEEVGGSDDGGGGGGGGATGGGNTTAATNSSSSSSSGAGGAGGGGRRQLRAEKEQQQQYGNQQLDKQEQQQQRHSRKLGVSLVIYYTLVVVAPSSSVAELTQAIQGELVSAFNTSAFASNLAAAANGTDWIQGVTLNVQATVRKGGK
jgi:hypothetical protein